MAPTTPRPTWDRWAGLYGAQEVLERVALDALAELLARYGPARGPLLDVATGRGAMLRALARSASPPSRAIGIDASPRMLAGVGALPPGWSVVEADASRLPFADGEFTTATAAYLLHTLDLPDRLSVLTELQRVLAPGCLIGVITIAPPATGATRPLLRALSAAADRSGGALVGLRSLDPRAELEAAGFDPLAGRITTRGYPSMSVVASRRH